MGLLRPHSGSVRFAGHDIGGQTPECIARLGVGLVPEGRQVFSRRSRFKKKPESALPPTGSVPFRPWSLERVVDLFPRLGERRDQLAGTLSGGEQQMLAVGRALMTNPRLLILDEATEGLAPTIRREIWQVVEWLKASGQSILLIDKNLGVLKRLADRHFVIDKGCTVWQGSSDGLEREEVRVRAYVGV